MEVERQPYYRKLLKNYRHIERGDLGPRASFDLPLPQASITAPYKSGEREARGIENFEW